MPTDVASEPQEAFVSPLMAAIDGRSFNLNIDQHQGRIYEAHGHLYLRLSRALVSAFNTVENHEKQCGDNWQIGGLSPEYDGDAALNLIYRAVEVFDFYHRVSNFYFIKHDIPQHLKISYSARIKILRDHWGKICNSCKHNDSILMPVQGTYASGRNVSGFSLYTRRGDYFIPHPEIHKTSDAISFNGLFRRLLSDLLQAEICAGQFVDGVSDVQTGLVLTTKQFTLPILGAIKRAIARPAWGMPFENMAISTIQQVETGVEVGSVPDAGPIEEEFRSSFAATLIGGSVELCPPFVGGFVRMDLSPADGVQRPLGGIFRATMAGMAVPPPSQLVHVGWRAPRP